MIDKIEVLAAAWDISVERLAAIAKKCGCLSKCGRMVLSSLLHEKLEGMSGCNRIESS